jgi:hypothetical protein
MAVTGYMYGNFPHLLLEDGIEGSILSQTIHVALLANTYTPNQNSHSYFSDVLAHEVSGAGYTHLGTALSGKTCTCSAGVTKFDASDVEWTGSTITARYAVIFYNKSGDTDHTASLLIGYVDFGEDKTTVFGTFTIQWATDGIISFAV